MKEEGVMNKARQATKQEAVEILARVIRASGWLHMDAYKILQEEFGLQGVMCVRQWLRRWGIWRGNQTRKGHLALGLDINMKNMLLYWDSAAAIPEANSDEWDMTQWRPCEVRTITQDFPGACEQADLWREHDFWAGGHILCDEFHVKYAQGYHPQAICAIPECLMKNDKICYHHFLLPDDYIQGKELELPLYEGEDPAADWAQSPPDKAINASLIRKSRITAGRIYFLKEAVYEMFPEEADRVYGKILSRWFKDRGNDLISYLSEKGIEATPENVIENFDQPLVYLYEPDLVTEDDATTVTLRKCPFAETFQWLEKEDSSAIYRYYCKNCCNEIMQTVHSDWSAELTDCRMKGDGQCCIKIKRRGE